MTVTALRSPSAASPAPAGSHALPAPVVAAVPASTAVVVSVVGSLSLLALWAVVYALGVSGLQEHASQQHLFDELRARLSQQTAPVGATREGDPVALLDLGKADVHGAVIAEGATSSDLSSGPGHVRGTVLPGQVGTSVVLGRSVTFGGPFRHLTDLHPGDTFSVTTGQGVFPFVVERLRRPGDPLPPTVAAGGSRLILGTSEGPGWRAGLAPTSVVYVDALLKGREAAPAGTSPSTPDTAELAMGQSSTPLLPLVFWLQGLLLVVLGLVWLRSRWGRWQTWAVGLPVGLALLVGASGVALQLLPNVV